MKYVFQIPLEFVLLLFYPLFGWIGIFLSKRQTYTSSDKPVIVIVERWFSSNPLHFIWVSYLKKQGFDVYIKNIQFTKGSFSDSARILRDFMDYHDFSHVTLVGVSNGGITSYLYLQHYGGWKRVKTFVSIASPFRGTLWMYLLSFFPSGVELVPQSRLVQLFENEPVTHPEDIYLLTARIDELVPISSTKLLGVHRRTIDVIGHNVLHLASKKTYQAISHLAEKKIRFA